MSDAIRDDRTAEPAPAWKADAVGLAALAALTAAAYFLGAAPLLERHASFAEQQTELVDTRRKTIEAATDLTALQEDSSRVQQRFAACPLRLQSADAINRRLALITDLAAESGAVLDDLQPGKLASGSQYGSLAIKVAGTGSYATFAALLRRLRERCPDAGINAFEVWTAPKPDQEAPAKFTFELVWYTEPLPQAEPGPAAPPGNANRK
jgi:hypothetical protein